MNAPTRVRSLFHRLTDLAALVGGIGIALLLLLVCVQAITRYVLHMPMGWVIPVVEYSVVVVTFLALPWLEQHGRHIRIEILLNVLGTRAHRRLQRLTALLTPLVSLLLAVAGWRVVQDLAARDVFTEDLLEIPLAPLIAVVPFGLGLLFCEQVLRGWDLWHAAPAAPGEEPAAGSGPP
jgi:TRAP-type C4-dicarboxylate transport system permease small subunit